MPKAANLIGKVFTRLTVIEKLGKDAKGNIVWKCSCTCGSIQTATTGQLNFGHVKSCGCIKGESHGKSGTRLHIMWKNMKGRCYRKSSTHYDRYGGRGITVCDEWKESFLTFEKWALENGYREDLTIDRIEEDGNYCPNNCRFIPSEKNTSLMSLHHSRNKSGGHSRQARLKLKEKNRENLGIRVFLIKDNEKLYFKSIGAAAEYLAETLGREFKSVYSQAKQVVNGKCKSIAGWEILKCEQ